MKVKRKRASAKELRVRSIKKFRRATESELHKDDPKNELCLAGGFAQFVQKRDPQIPDPQIRTVEYD